MDKVSVIIPAYNRENTIIRAINSVINQDYQPYEIIVIDDFSKDRTVEEVEKLKDNRIKIIRHSKNLGAAAARNTGIKQATGNIIAFQDSDDYWYKEKLSKQMQVLINSDFQAIFSLYKRNYQNITEVIPDLKKQKKIKKDMKRVILTANYIGTPTLIVKKEVFNQIGYFDENLFQLEDWEFCIRLVSYCKIFFLNEVLLDAYIQKNSITLNQGANVHALEYILRKFYDILSQDNKTLSVHFRRLGNAYIEKEIERAKKYYRLSLKTNPLSVKSIVKYLLLIFTVHLKTNGLFNNSKKGKCKSNRIRNE